jgi:hypothetical protein
MRDSNSLIQSGSLVCNHQHLCCNLERIEGIEPSSSAWQADIITIIRHPHGAETGSAPTVAFPSRHIEQMMGIEPTTIAWQAIVLPLALHLH